MEHTEKVKRLINILIEYKNKLTNLGHNILLADNGRLFPLDLVVIGIVKRSLSLTSAFILLIQEFNIICARAILRMHIDTALRLSAFWIVDDPHNLAQKVISGKQINKQCDKNGHRMTDGYLAENLSKKYQWIKKVYKYTSGYIHFSERHLFDPISEIRGNEKVVKFIISEKDYKFPEFSWLELLECYIETLEIIMSYLEGYKRSKSGNA